MPFTSRAPGRSLCLAALLIFAVAGCASTKTSNTDRTAMEQLLISNAIDQSLNRVDFTPLDGHTVFFDSTLIDCVDKNYIVASTRARILQAGGQLVDKKEEAEIAVEIRSGAVGTDQSEMFVGMPAMSVPGPLPIAVPEVKLWSRSTQTGTAKLGLIAYETESREVIGTGGTILARSDDSNSYFLGMGPWQSGSVRKEVKRQLGRPEWYPLPNTIAFNSPLDDAEPARLRIADSEANSQGVDKPQTPAESLAGNAQSEKASHDESKITISPASMDASFPHAPAHSRPNAPPAGVTPTTGTGGDP